MKPINILPERIQHTLDTLSARFPSFQRPPKPLQIGILKVLFEALETEIADPTCPISKKALRKALAIYTKRTNYLLALARSDAMRHNLSGQAVEPVAEEHGYQAQMLLRTRKLQQPREAKQKMSRRRRSAMTLKRPRTVTSEQQANQPPRPARKPVITIKRSRRVVKGSSSHNY